MTGLRPIGIGNLAFGALAVLLIAGCSSTNATAPSPPPQQPGQSASTQAGLEVFYGQQVDWRNCGDADCTSFEVPLDYQDPQGDRVTLSMSKVRSRGESIGSLFVNPGGPGGSAFEYAKAADYIVTDQIRESFDVVGVDPRGVGFSDTIRCLTDEQIDALISADGSPDTELEESRLILDAGFIGQACENSGNPLIAHMSTVEVARDMDIARALVGDPVMNLLGKSYGTAIGTTYMELFPGRVGRMVHYRRSVLVVVCSFGLRLVFVVHGSLLALGQVANPCYHRFVMEGSPKIGSAFESHPASFSPSRRQAGSLAEKQD